MSSSFKYLIREGFRNIWTNRLMSFASIGVLVCCLVLMGSAALISVNVSGMMGWLSDQNVVMVFMDESFDGSEEMQAQAESNIMSVGNISKLEFVPRKEAYESIVSSMGGNYDLIMAIDDTGDFLPDAYKVTFSDLTRFEETVVLLQAVDQVLTVSSKSELVVKLRNINQIVTVVGIWVVGLLFIVSLFIITNTIKLTMYVRRLEISIMKSVGATDGFIRTPFLVEGIIIGLVSGLVAFGIVSYVYVTALSAVSSVITFGLVSYDNLWLYCLITFVLAGSMAGSVGSMISISKYLHQEGGINV